MSVNVLFSFAFLQTGTTDIDRDVPRDTPDRVARAWAEQLEGRDQSAEDVLKTTFDSALEDGGSYDQIVALRGIQFYSTCEHHLLPFHGEADVAYLPSASGRVVGLSKLARLVQMHARRLQLQERLTQGVAHDLQRVLDARGVAVVVRATHLCMCARGVRQAGATMLTSAMLGVFYCDASARAEVLSLFRA